MASALQADTTLVRIQDRVLQGFRTVASLALSKSVYGSSNLSVPANKLLWVGRDDGGVAPDCKSGPFG